MQDNSWKENATTTTSTVSNLAIAVSPTQFAVKEGGMLKIEPAKTKLNFTRSGDQVVMNMSVTFAKDDNVIVIGKDVEFQVAALFDFDADNFKNVGSIFSGLELVIDSADNDTVRVRSESSDFDINTNGEKREHGQSAP